MDNNNNSDIEALSWIIWELAWDKARSADEIADRRYSKERYYDAATAARKQFLISKGVK